MRAQLHHSFAVVIVLAATSVLGCDPRPACTDCEDGGPTPMDAGVDPPDVARPDAPLRGGSGTTCMTDADCSSGGCYDRGATHVCASSCEPSEACAAGYSCESFDGVARCLCPDEHTICEDLSCRDLRNDVLNCGDCGTVCPFGAECTAGACVCPGANAAVCDGICRDLDSTRPHCGECGRRCASSSCEAGACDDMTFVASGYVHTCAMHASGRMSCWGWNHHGQLGTGDTVQQYRPARVVGVLDAVAVGVGEYFTCAVRASGIVSCWGSNDAGQLGAAPGVLASATPVDVPGVTGALAIATDRARACAVLDDGGVTCWGGGFMPATRIAGLPEARAVRLGYEHSCALTTAGEIWCWGVNGDGQFGDGTFVSHPEPRRTPLDRPAIALAAGGDVTCAVLDDGGVVCFGKNDRGQVGDGSIGGRRPTPTRVAGIGEARDVVLGPLHACAVLADGSMACWGGDRYGGLGDGEPGGERGTARPVGGIGDVAVASAGTFHTCAVLEEGAAMCWGDNSAFQLGTGRLEASASEEPQEIEP